MKGRLFVGTSGWFYEHWYGRFYPENLPKEDLLPYYAKFFDTVEINSTFYHMPKKSTVLNWVKKVPRDFLFVVKASRFITHIKKLKPEKDSLKLFFDITPLFKKRLGPILFQLPPSMKRNDKTLSAFLKRLPKGFRYVMEFRNETWFCEEVYKILEDFNTAYCIVSMPHLPMLYKATTDFVYIRMHGKEALYGSNYPRQELLNCAKHIKEFLSQGKDCYIYFNNDYNAYAVKNALELKKIFTA